MVRAYCMVDKQIVEMSDPQEEMAKNGRPRLIGKCPICKGNIYKFMKTDDLKSAHVRSQVQKHAASYSKKHTASKK